MKKIIIYLISVCVLALGSVGCKDSKTIIDSSNEAEYKMVEGGEVTLPLTGFDGLNPMLKSSPSVYYFNKLIFEGLFSIEEDLDIRTTLAESYSISEDARSIDIVLKDDIHFHDGSKLTSEDVIFTIETLKAGNAKEEYRSKLSSMYKAGGVYDMDRIDRVEASSDRNIKILFDKSFSDAPEYLTFPIVSKKSLKSKEKALSQEGYSPIGTGPYSVESVDDLKQVVLTKNKDYWSEKPNIDKIKGRVVMDEKLAKISFEAGRVHVISDIDYLNWEAYAQNDKVNISSFSSNKYEFIGFNFKNELFQGEKGKKLREAIFHGINREQILKNVYLGYGQLVETPVNPESWLKKADDKSEKDQYDLEKSAEILKGIGFEDRDADGVLEDGEGKKLKITIKAPPTSQARIDTAELVSESLKKIGIDVEEGYSEKAGTYKDEEDLNQAWDEFESDISNGEYDLAVMGWEMSYLPDLSFAFHSESDSKYNFIGYSDKTLDEMLEKANGTNSREEKKNIYDKIQKHITDEKPYISILYTDGAMISYKRMQGEFSPNYMDAYSRIESWFVPEEFQTEKE